MSNRLTPDIFELNDPALTPPEDPLFPRPDNLSVAEKKAAAELFAPLIDEFLRDDEKSGVGSDPESPARKFSILSLLRTFRAKKK